MVSNEVYTGAGVSATLIPEMDIDLTMTVGADGSSVANTKLIQLKSGETKLFEWTASDNHRLIPSLYKGCLVKAIKKAATGADLGTADVGAYYTITANTANSITLDRSPGSATDYFQLILQGYGSPMWAKSQTASKYNLLADNWLGLVTTFSPPTVNTNIKQVNMALGGSRNYTHQYKGAETVDDGSIDLAMNNGSWLYYALGKKTLTATQDGSSTFGSTVSQASIAEVTTYTFEDTTKANYNDDSFTFAHLNAEDGTPTVETVGITTDGSYGGATATISVDVSDSDINTRNEIIDAIVNAINLDGALVTAVRTSNTLVITNTHAGATTTAITSDAADISLVVSTTGADAVSSASGNATYYKGNVLYRGDTSLLLPPREYGTAVGSYKKWNAEDVTYTFSESNSGDLPSFALELTTEKGSTGALADASYLQDANSEVLFSRIVTGCQVQSLAMNFNEGEELTSSVSFVGRRVFDTPTDYVPRKRVRTNDSELYNFSSSKPDNEPFMFSDGGINAFGQNWAKVKSGTVTINNNLTPQRFIGNYSSDTTSSFIAGQRTYEITLNLLITDNTMWNYLREKNETNSGDAGMGTLDLNFEKSTGEKITMPFDNYIVTSVDIPYPDDKGQLEVAVSLSARSLGNVTYTGKWIIQG